MLGPEVVIGRSPECQITIEDPLVSRQHARIRLLDNTALIMDLGSRNGVRVNGELIRGDTPLKHNDRVRLGTQDLVFLVVDTSPERMSRATGFMLHCAGCGRPFPGEAPSCPHCGARVDDDTNTARGPDTLKAGVQRSQASWTVQLLGEVIERALSDRRIDEAERMIGRAIRELEEQTTAGVALDSEHLSRVSAFAVRLAQQQQKAGWAEWALRAHLRYTQLPAAVVLDALEALDESLRDMLHPSLRKLDEWWQDARSAVASDTEQQLARRLRELIGQSG